MDWKPGFAKVKRRLGRVCRGIQKVLSVADRAHALLSKGFNTVEDRLEPEARQAVGSALYTYGKRRRQLANIDQNVREISANVARAFPEYGG